MIDIFLPHQDIEEVEEWNEYGEIKQNLLQPGDLPSTSTPTPSTISTPSKPPPPAPVLYPTQPKQPAETPSSLPRPLNVRQPASVSNPAPINLNPETPLTAAMRQASLEAAAKANASKAQKIASYGIRQTPSTITPGSEPSDKNNAEALKRLESSTAGDSVPPTGSTEASEAKEPVADAKPKMNTIAFNGDKEKAKEVAIPTVPEEPVMKHRGSSVSIATAEEIKAVEEASKITEEPEKGDGKKGEVGETKMEIKREVGEANKGAVEGVKIEDATVATGEKEKPLGTKTAAEKARETKKEAVEEPSKGAVEGVKTEDATVADEEEGKLPGTRTQEQEAASAGKAGESVAD